MSLDGAALLAFLINGAVQAAIVAAGTAVALRLVRTARAWIKHRVAVVGVALCGAVPLLCAWPAARLDGLAVVGAAPVNTSAFAGGHAADVLIWGYVSFVVWRLAALLRAVLAYKRLRRGSTPITEGAIFASLQRCHRVGPAIRLCRSTRAITPLVCGVAHPAIVVPDDLADCDRDVIDAVIAHECAHVVRRDVAVAMAVEVLTAPFAWHPAVAALKRSVTKHREVACDEMAVARLRIRRTSYAAVLLRIAERRAHLGGAVACGAGTRLEARVRDLLEAPPARRIRRASQVLVGLCLGAATAAAPLTTIAVDVGRGDLSGNWTLDLDQSQPRGQLPFRAVRLHIDATADRVHMAQQRTRRDGVDERVELRRTTDDVPSNVTLPGGMVVRTRARWEGLRLVTNSSTPEGGWREHVEAMATRSRLVIRYENETGHSRSRYTFVFRRE